MGVSLGWQNIDITSVFLAACTALFEVKLYWAHPPSWLVGQGWGARALLCCWLAWRQWTTTERALWEGWWCSLEAREARTRYSFRSSLAWPILQLYDTWSPQESHFFRRSMCFSSTSAFMHLNSACICGTEDLLFWLFQAQIDLSYYLLDYCSEGVLPCYCLLFFACYYSNKIFTLGCLLKRVK